jgi:ferric-dicitrate binding protein FerR (iron transport regulator)
VNEQEFAKMKAIWEAAAYPMQPEEIAQALARTKTKIAAATQEEEESTVHLGTKPFTTWIRRVAAILVLGFAAYFIYQQVTKEVYLTKTTTDHIDSLLLADGSKIYLAANTSFSYPQKMNGKTRQVNLINGEAFFKVAKDSLRPFTVVLNNAKVTVLGTSFNIHNTPRSVDLTVNSGKVAFEAVSGNDKAILTAGMGLNYNVSTNNIIRFSSVNHNDNYWLNKELIFVNASLQQVFASLENCYGVTIKVRNSIKFKHKFNAEFKNTSIQEVLEVLKATYPIELSLKDREIIVKHK